MTWAATHHEKGGTSMSAQSHTVTKAVAAVAAVAVLALGGKAKTKID